MRKVLEFNMNFNWFPKCEKSNLENRPVVVKDLKAVDVQHADDRVLAMTQWVVVFNLDNTVDPAHDPAEQALVESLEETREC